jgi:hypothetical protein
MQFRITPGTRVQQSQLELTFTKSGNAGIFARERRLSSATPLVTDAGTTAGPHWPEQLEPTRNATLPPDGYIPGNAITDLVYPIEDIYYHVQPGWLFRAVTEGADQGFQTVPVPGGCRLRLLNPDNPVLVKFVIAQTPMQNAPMSMAAQSVLPNQPAFPWNTPQTAQRQGQPPGNSPYPGSQQPSYNPPAAPPPTYYPTTRSAPTYYPASSPPQRRPR